MEPNDHIYVGMFSPVQTHIAHGSSALVPGEGENSTNGLTHLSIAYIKLYNYGTNGNVHEMSYHVVGKFSLSNSLATHFFKGILDTSNSSA